MIDNIDIDLSNVQLGMPVLDGVVLCRTGTLTVKKTQSGLARLVIPLVIEEPCKDVTGKEIHPGFVTPVGFLLQPTGGLTPERVAEECGKFQVAALKLEKQEGSFKVSDVLAGRYNGLPIKVKFVPQKDDPTRQDVKAWIKAG